jgi:transcriptional regulator with XRE-family HTH domain
MSEEGFGPRLKELREAAGLTQRDLAEAIGSTIRNISRLETGTQEATWPTVLKLARVLGVDCTAFTQEPADAPPAKPGRPPKAVEADQGEAEKPKGKAKGARKKRGG